MLQRITNVKPAPDNSAVNSVISTAHVDPREIILRLLRKRGFASPRALALRAGVSQPTLSRYLSGTSDDMEMATWRALARELGVTVSQLLGEQPLTADDSIEHVVRAMETMPQSLRDALAAAADAMAGRKA